MSRPICDGAATVLKRLAASEAFRAWSPHAAGLCAVGGQCLRPGVGELVSAGTNFVPGP